jgi:hypothetical protein
VSQLVPLARILLINLVLTPNASSHEDYNLAMNFAQSYEQAAFNTVTRGARRVALHPLQLEFIHEFEDSYAIFMEAEQYMNQHFAQQDIRPLSNTTITINMSELQNTTIAVNMLELQNMIASTLREQLTETVQQAVAAYTTRQQTTRSTARAKHPPPRGAQPEAD